MVIIVPMDVFIEILEIKIVMEDSIAVVMGVIIILVKDKDVYRLVMAQDSKIGEL